MSRHFDDGNGRDGLAYDTPEEREIERLQKDVTRLRKILSHVPARIALEATEKAGYGSVVRTMARPSTGHPACEHRCNICGGVVHYDGTPPVPGNWGGR